MKEAIAIFWFRRDLRLVDNAGLYHTLRENKQVLPVFIFDKTILDGLENKQDRRVDFIHQACDFMHSELTKTGSGLTCIYGHPLEAFKELLNKHTVSCVYTNHDYEPYAQERDQTIEAFLNSKGVGFKTYKDQCIFEKNEVTKDDGKPYTIFTPYSNKWKKTLKPFYYKAYPCEKYFNHFLKYQVSEFPKLESMGFIKTDFRFQVPSAPQAGLLQNYKQQRDFPASPGTSRLSVHLRFGTVSIRQLVAQSIGQSETWLNELIWRDFYMMILFHFPHVVNQAFKKEYDRIPWRNNEQEFQTWCRGQTGFPIVDAGMRELNTTGFMHNRVRMIVSSFLIKDLLIDWRWGEAYFASQLNDFDLSANNGGWQWASSGGCDAAPYFRVFNPVEQQKKFDPKFEYIKKWVPEFGTSAYALPMVDHAAARLRVINVYKKALSDSKQIELF